MDGHERCPACGRKPATKGWGSMQHRLESVGRRWTAVADGASRGYVHKLRERYPSHEFRAERTSMFGGTNGTWRIEARRR